MLTPYPHTFTQSLGKPYQALRAMRPFIFHETGQITLSPGAAKISATVSSMAGNTCEDWLRVLHPVDVWHHLIARGPPDLLLPHIRLKWTLNRYSRWLDEKQPEDVWQEVKRSLDEYAAQVDRRGEQQYHPIYPVLLSLGPALIALYHAQQQQQQQQQSQQSQQQQS